MKCGYRGTKLFEEARNIFFEGEDSKIEIINKFVQDFDKIAAHSEEDRNERLKAFWEAADAIDDTLHKMRPGMDEDSMFGEYFEKI